MKQQQIQGIYKLVIVALVLLAPAILLAQPPGFDDGVEDVPVDGGLSLLIAAGAGYGARKLKKNKKKEQ
jgi:hypothetical protein